MTEQTTLLIAIGLVALCVGAIGFALFGGEPASAARRLSTPGRDKRRASAGAAGFSTLFKREEMTAVDRLRMLSEEQKRNERANLRLRLTQAGLSSSPARFLLTFYIVAVAAAGALYVALGQPLVSALAAVVIGFLGPRIVLGSMIKRRVRAFAEHFPSALDVLVRGVRTGLPVNESMKIVAAEIPAPVGPEIERLIVGSQLGQSLDEGLQQLALRVPTQDVNFFRTVLSIQQKSGGNLAETLEILSSVLRERKKMKLKIHALSSEARMSAIIIGSLPFIVGLLVYILRPDYIGLLFDDPRGHWMIGGGLIWMTFGVLMMRNMIRFEV